MQTSYYSVKKINKWAKKLSKVTSIQNNQNVRYQSKFKRVIDGS